MMPAFMKNIGHWIHAEYAMHSRASFDSGSYTSGTSVSGTGAAVVDRADLPRWFNSCKVVVPFTCDLSSGKSFTVTAVLKDSTASGGSYVAHSSTFTKTATNATTATSAVTYNCLQGDVDLTGADRFLKIAITHYGGGNTATGSTILVGAPVLVFGGAVQTPATSTEA